jgi:hypothetical protein
MSRAKAIAPKHTKKKKSSPKRERPTAVRRRTRKPAAPPVEEPLAPAPVVETEVVPAIESVPSELELPLSSPETLFAERVAPQEADRPFPADRRAIFFDVENTSRAQHISRVIEHLQIDRRGYRTEFVAVGNWRVIGHDTARLLARHGAHLVHSAPSVGVRDWSDLRIAVAAGAWLAGARPGDLIEIVSDDRAFDAVGDVAASLGITYRRLSYRGLTGAPVEEVPRAVAEPSGGGESRAVSSDRRGHRYRGRYRGRRDGRPMPAPPAAPPPAPAPPPPRVEAIADGEPAEPHTAPHDEIIEVVRELIRAAPARVVSIDTLANALKARGFSRPPGSPRLITRLRRLKELELNRAGMITLVDSAPVREEPEPEPEPPRRVVPVVAEPVDVDEDEGPQPGNERVDSRPPARDDSGGQRRRRRGGRRRRGRGRPQPSATP